MTALPALTLGLNPGLLKQITAPSQPQTGPSLPFNPELFRRLQLQLQQPRGGGIFAVPPERDEFAPFPDENLPDFSGMPSQTFKEHVRQLRERVGLPPQEQAIRKAQEINASDKTSGADAASRVPANRNPD